MDERTKILVMASGNGSNFQALLDAVKSGDIPNSRIIRLVVNRAKAYATTRADSAGVPWEYFNLISNGFLSRGEKDEETVRQARERYDAALADKIVKGYAERPSVVVLAGWMHVFGAAFLSPLKKAGIRCINLHPALPNAYNGAGAIERAYEDFRAGRASRTGIMVHDVIEAVDEGEPIMVQEIAWEGEDLAALQEKIHAHEHKLLVAATAQVVREVERDGS